ncbi:acetyltransferase, partial [Brachymonas denitrificans]
MSAIYTVLASLLVALNTLAGALLMLPFALIKFLLPIKAVRALCDHALNSIATGWVSVNGAWINAINRTRWRVSGLEGLNTKSWYLVISNHQSWVDILVLQTILNRRAPFLKFFIKHELIYVPVIGLVWWALDFPFMKRGGAATVQQDLENARKAC